MYLPRNQRRTVREKIPCSIRNAFNMYIELHPYICPVCGERIWHSEDMHIGHIISCFHNGKSDIENLVAMHAECNQIIGTDDVTELVKHAPDEIKSKFLMFKQL